MVVATLSQTSPFPDPPQEKELCLDSCTCYTATLTLTASENDDGGGDGGDDAIGGGGDTSKAESCKTDDDGSEGFVDCAGRCLSSGYSEWIADGGCDNGDIYDDEVGSVTLNYATFEFDGGDCEGEEGDDEMLWEAQLDGNTIAEGGTANTVEFCFACATTTCGVGKERGPTMRIVDVNHVKKERSATLKINRVVIDVRGTRSLRA